MKFVFALALVAVCVMLMHARPNVKRSADADLFKVNKRNGQNEEGHGRDRAKKLDKILKRNDDDGGERQHVSGNGNTKTKEAPLEKTAEKNEEIGEGTPHTQNDEFRVDKRGATNLNTIKLWPGGKVSYKFVPDDYGTKKSKKGESLADLVKQAAVEWKQKAGVDIVLDQDAETNVIEIKSKFGCWSFIGYQGSGKGRNEISLQDNTCFDKGVILHEMGHAIGFMHEAQRTDRNAYIDVYEDNIDPDYKLQFVKSDNAKPVTTQSSEFDARILGKYDYCSIMHYSATAFSKNKENTIDIDDRTLLPCLGGHYSLSILDGEVMAFLYGNLGSSDEQKVCQNDGYMLKSGNKCICSELFTGNNCENPITDSCGEAVNTLTKLGDIVYFMTPGYSAAKSEAYPLNRECEWEFKAPDYTKLCLGFPTGFDIEEPDTKGRCSFDYMQIIDDIYYPDVERYCGKEQMFSKLSEENILVVRFISDDMFALRGFQGVAVVVNRQATEEECENAIASGGATISSGATTSND